MGVRMTMYAAVRRGADGTEFFDCGTFAYGPQLAAKAAESADREFPVGAESYPVVRVAKVNAEEVEP